MAFTDSTVGNTDSTVGNTDSTVGKSDFLKVPKPLVKWGKKTTFYRGRFVLIDYL